MHGIVFAHTRRGMVMREKYKDFKEYMQQNYYNEIFQSVEKFTYANKGRLNIESGHIYEVTYQKSDGISYA